MVDFYFTVNLFALLFIIYGSWEDLFLWRRVQRRQNRSTNTGGIDKHFVWGLLFTRCTRKDRVLSATCILISVVAVLQICHYYTLLQWHITASCYNTGVCRQDPNTAYLAMPKNKHGFLLLGVGISFASDVCKCHWLPPAGVNKLTIRICRAMQRVQEIFSLAVGNLRL